MLEILRKTLKQAHKDKISNLAASLTFYAIFALAPIIIIIIAVAGVFFGEQAVKGELVMQISNVVGPEIASSIQLIVENAHISTSNLPFTIMSLLIFLYAASKIVTQLRDALNKIWDFEKVPLKKVHRIIRSKFLSMLVIVVLGFLFVVLLTLSGLMATVWIYVGNFLGLKSTVFSALNLVISFGLIAFIISLMYKYLPDIKISWKNAWIGAIFTTVLFLIGNYLIGLYMRNVSVGSVYGAAGSLIVILIWLYYISQIFLVGAEFIKVYAQERGLLKNRISNFLKGLFS